jgi:uracil-DNA glycosylase
MPKQELLNDLYSELNKCETCKHLGSLVDVKVTGSGNVASPLMSLSEAPGKDEYTEKRVYSGKAGKYWESMLSSVGWNRNKIYATNALKCRPMYEGKSNCISPSQEEIYNCNKFLFDEIAIIQPKVIVVFGKTAAMSLGLLSKTDSLSSVLGQWSRNKGCLYAYGENQCDLIVTYHPSYLMRGGKEKENGQSYIHLTTARLIIDGMDKR